MEFEPSAKDYLDLASEVNEIAGNALRLETRDASLLAAKVSLGLSLQAAELVGKGIFRCLGVPSREIRQRYGNHKLLPLLREASEALEKSTTEHFRAHWDFLYWSPTIEGEEFGSTIDLYFEQHFAKGSSAFPRSYFYPDEEVFPGPVPIQAVYLMVEHLIGVLAELVIADDKQVS